MDVAPNSVQHVSQANIQLHFMGEKLNNVNNIIKMIESPFSSTENGLFLLMSAKILSLEEAKIVSKRKQKQSLL